MILVFSITAAFLFGAGFYQIFRPGLLNRTLGLLLISHGANWVLMCTAGALPRPRPPILPDVSSAGSLADPLPQALILTALVIGFALAAFLWALVLRLGKESE